MLMVAGLRSGAQTNQPVQDSGPASSNIPGQQYPRIDAELRATFRVKAPDAQKVQVSVGATYDMTTGDDGFWTVTTKPLVVGFHYYWIVIDGVKADDPASETFFGVGQMSGGIEAPSKGEDFGDVKDACRTAKSARGGIFQKAANVTRHCFVFIRRRIMTRKANPGTRYFTCNTAWARTDEGGQPRGG